MVFLQWLDLSAETAEVCFLAETGLPSLAEPETDAGTQGGQKYLSYTGPAVLLTLESLGSQTEMAALQG